MKAVPARRTALVISDIDGTLVTKDKQLTERSVAAVRALGDAGVAFALTSSRPAFGMRMLIEPLCIRTPVAAFNGGLIVDPETFAPFEGHALSASVSRRAIDFLERKGVSVWFDTDCDWFLLDAAGPYVDHEISTIQTSPKTVSTFDAPDIIDGGYKIVGASRDFDLLARCESGLRDELGAEATVARSQLYYLDITHPLANKGHGVLALSRLLSVPAAAIAVIGDGRNDVAMFDVAGLAIAMGNAEPEVQERAQLVTASNEEDGFAAAIERWVLPWAGAGQTGAPTRLAGQCPP
jgi:Cof subfamily protein (haloacid dehalogenase superfamily)